MDNPEFLLALIDARLVAGDASLFERLRGRRSTCRGRTRTCSARCRRSSTRVTRSSTRTLYQLEPDVKDAPGGLRDIAAARTIAAASDPALLRRNARRAAAGAGRGVPAARPIARCTSSAGATTTCSGTSSRRRSRRSFGYPGQSPRQQVEALMADYFSHARAVARVLDRARRTAPVPVGVNLGAHGATACGSSTRARRRSSRRPGWPRSSRRSTPIRPSPTRRWSDPAARRGLFVRRDFPTAAHRAALLRLLVPRPRPLRPAVGDARLRPARPHGPAVPGDHLPRRARLLPQVHRRRAHAPDDPERSSASSVRRTPGRASRPCCARSRPRSCWCSRCCCTTSARRATTTTRSKACGWRSGCSMSCSCRRAARETVLFLVAPSPAHVAGGVPARHRGSGNGARVRRRRRHRGAPEAPLPDDAGRRGRGQPRDADALERRAAVAALRRHLQLPDAAVRRRSDRADAGRRRRMRRAPAGGSGGRRSGAAPRGAAAALPAAVRSAPPSTITSGSRATSTPTRCTCGSSRPTQCGS